MHNLRPRKPPVCIDDAAPLAAMHLSSKTAKQNAQPPLSPAKPSKRSKKTKVATPAKTGKKSQYRGVWRRASGKWTAQLCHRGKNEDLGKFDDEKSAARAYDARARELGMHSRCNFDEDDEPPPQRNVQGGTGYSQFLGVTYQKGKYQAQISKNFKDTFVTQRGDLFTENEELHTVFQTILFKEEAPALERIRLRLLFS